LCFDFKGDDMQINVAGTGTISGSVSSLLIPDTRHWKKTDLELLEKAQVSLGKTIDVVSA